MKQFTNLRELLDAALSAAPLGHTAMVKIIFTCEKPDTQAKNVMKKSPDDDSVVADFKKSFFQALGDGENVLRFYIGAAFDVDAFMEHFGPLIEGNAMYQLLEGMFDTS